MCLTSLTCVSVRATVTVCSRTVETNKNHSLPPGAVLVARRAEDKPSKFSVRSSSPSKAAAADKSSTVTHPTESSTQKLFRPLPNKANTETGWGPIENLTVAALDFQHGKPRVPQQDEAFTELAEWIYEHSQHLRRQKQQQQQVDVTDQQAGTQDTDLASAGPAGKGIEYYQRLATQLLALHNSVSTHLAQPSSGPKLNTAARCARQLWNSIPQPDHMPAVRPSPIRTTTARSLRPLPLLSKSTCSGLFVLCSGFHCCPYTTLRSSFT